MNSHTIHSGLEHHLSRADHNTTCQTHIIIALDANVMQAYDACKSYHSALFVCLCDIEVTKEIVGKS